MPEKLLMPREDYLASGIHIGMKQRTADMKPYIYKIRADGLAVLNLGLIDERIRTAAKFCQNAKQFWLSEGNQFHKMQQRNSQKQSGRNALSADFCQEH